MHAEIALVANDCPISYIQCSVYCCHVWRCRLGQTSCCFKSWRFSGNHNRWTALFRHDLLRLLDAHDNETCRPALDIPSALFTCDYIKESFLPLDIKAIRSVSRGVCIPPPGFAPVVSVAPIEVVELPFACPHSDPADPCPCFETKQALTLHVVRKHGHKQMAQALTCANACIVCGNVYASKLYAARHLGSCLDKGKCPASRGSVFMSEITFKSPFKCTMCLTSMPNEVAVEYHTYAEARAHLRTHLPPHIQALIRNHGQL